MMLILLYLFQSYGIFLFIGKCYHHRTTLQWTTTPTPRFSLINCNIPIENVTVLRIFITKIAFYQSVSNSDLKIGMITAQSSICTQLLSHPCELFWKR